MNKQVRRIGGHVSIAGKLRNSVERTLEIGGNCLQIFSGSPRVWKRPAYELVELTEYRALLREYNLTPLIVHAMYLINVVSDNEVTARRSIETLISELKFANSVGAAGLVVHIGSSGSRSYELVHDNLVEILTTILDSVSGKTRLLIENSAGQKGKIGSLHQLQRLLTEVEDDRLGICLDTAHLWGDGFDLRDQTVVDDLALWVTDNCFESKIGCLHINDSPVDLGSGRDIHANIGEGKLGEKGIANLINHPVFVDHALLLEVPGSDSKQKGPDAANIERVRQLLE